MADSPDTNAQPQAQGSSKNLEPWQRATLGALLLGAAGAAGGAYMTDTPEDMTPSEVLKERIKNALIVGGLGAVGGLGLGYAFGEAGVGGDPLPPNVANEASVRSAGSETARDVYLKKGVSSALGGGAGWVAGKAATGLLPVLRLPVKGLALIPGAKWRSGMSTLDRWLGSPTLEKALPAAGAVGGASAGWTRGNDFGNYIIDATGLGKQQLTPEQQQMIEAAAQQQQ